MKPNLFRRITHGFNSGRLFLAFVLILGAVSGLTLGRLWAVSSAARDARHERIATDSFARASAKASNVAGILVLGLGNYPNTTLNLGANTTVTPDAVPTSATSINISTATDFKGTFSADPATGVVRVTNAHPAGLYTVTVRAFSGIVSVTKTFALTVQPGTAC